MSEFDAGTILATMDLNRDPMVQGLERAKTDMREIQDSKHDVEMNVEADTTKARVEIDRLDQSVRNATGGASAGGGPGGGGMMGLIGAAAALAPALIPVGSAAVAVGGGFMAMMAEVGVAGMIFSKVAGADMKDMQAALTKVHDNASLIRPDGAGRAGVQLYEGRG